MTDARADFIAATEDAVIAERLRPGLFVDWLHPDLAADAKWYRDWHGRVYAHRDCAHGLRSCDVCRWRDRYPMEVLGL